MRSLVHWIFGLTLTLMLLTGSARALTLDNSSVPVRHKFGDDPRWAARDWDDHDWAPGNILPSRTGVYWLRFTITTPVESPRIFPVDRQLIETPLSRPPSDQNSSINGVFLAAAFSFELFWDGRLVGRSGVVGASRAEEVAGRLDNRLVIPDDLLAPGEHVIALRISSFHFNFAEPKMDIHFSMGNYEKQLIWETRRGIFPTLGVGCAGLVALVTAVLFWFVDRRRPLLLCSALSFALAIFYLLIAWRWLHNDPYDWLRPRYLAITVMMTLISVLLPWLLLEQFAVPRRGRWLAILVPLLAAAWMTGDLHEINTLWLCRAMLAVSLAISGWAAWKRRAGAVFVFIPVLAGLVMVRTAHRSFLDPSFFVIFNVLVLVIFTLLGLRIRANRQSERAAALRAARLEIELLKKNIQPHFIMNTLTSLMEVVEQDSRSALRMIEALAGEFRLLAQVAGERVVPLAKELELCRTHLRIMSEQRGRSFVLKTEGVDETAKVPPALFHTLIENGLSHQVIREGSAVFFLRASHGAQMTSYELIAPGEPESRQRDGAPVEGTGLRYVKTRLEESFPGQWKLESGPLADGQGWRTRIELYVGAIDRIESTSLA